MNTLRAELIGVWELVSYRVSRSGGSTLEPLGPAPRGYGVYTDSGFMSAQLMGTERLRFQTDRTSFSDPHKPEIAAAAAAFDSYIAYCGSYEVDPERHEVTHHVRCSLFPNWVDTSLRRTVEFRGNLLVLQPPARPHSAGQQQTELSWRRASG